MILARLLLLATVLLLPVAARAQQQDPQQPPPSGPQGGDLLPAPGSLSDTTQDVRWRVGGSVRLRRDLVGDSLWLTQYLDSLDNTDSARMARNLTMSPADWTPTRAERAARELEIWRSMGMHEIHTGSYIPLFSANLNSMFMSLGLAEDVTPRIRYTLERTSQVTVLISNMDADTVALLVNGPQAPGVYSFDWDFRAADGRRVPYGSYIADVVVDKVLVLRKRILAP